MPSQPKHLPVDGYSLQFHLALEAALSQPGTPIELSVGSKKALQNLRHRFRGFLRTAKLSPRYRKGLAPWSIRCSLSQSNLGVWVFSFKLAPPAQALDPDAENYLQEQPQKP